MSGAVQLSLFPVRGFALQVFDRLLVGGDGLPSARRTRRAARDLARRSAIGESAWWRDMVTIVPVTVHPPDACSELPTYIIEET